MNEYLEICHPDFFVEDFTREEFEKICKPILKGIFAPIDRVLAKVGLSKFKIDSVLMVGGTSLIPLVR